ncbi:MAG: hypothetical protein R3Y19_02015, partial [Rikenellaceae bacterium]
AKVNTFYLSCKLIFKNFSFLKRQQIYQRKEVAEIDNICESTKTFFKKLSVGIASKTLFTYRKRLQR